MDAWITPQVAPWFSLVSFTSVFSVLSYFARRGEHRTLVTLVWGAGALLGVVMLVAAGIGVAIGQPWYVLIALGVPGVVLSFVYGLAVLLVQRVYQAAEMRKSMAKDL